MGLKSWVCAPKLFRNAPCPHQIKPLVADLADYARSGANPFHFMNMKDFPSCFGENGVQVAEFSSSNANSDKAAHNVVTCVYQCGFLGKSCWITVTWSKNLMGQGLSVGIDDGTNQCLCKTEIKPWLFSKKKGSKKLEADLCKIDMYWDFSSAKFGSGPEPLKGFYLGLVFEKQMILLLGDMRNEALKRTGSLPAPLQFSAILISKREQMFGKTVFSTRAQFCNIGQVHDLVIECDTSGVSDPCLVIRVDSKPTMQVKRLRWKFRGNHTILVDGLAVQVFWDVHNWLFAVSPGNAVFMFNTNVPSDKLWTGQPLYDPHTLHWSRSQKFQASHSQNLGFSLILHAWKNE